ncbi:MAG: sulfatase-like hydrolase/transferase [Acidobacteriota bacterium]
MKHRRRPRWTSLALLAVACSGLAGCAGPVAPRDGQRQLHQRLIPTAPDQRFDGSALIELAAVESWNLTDWTADGADLEDRQGTGGRFLRSSRQYQTLSQPVTLDAAEVDAFELLLGRTKGASFSLHWHGPNQTFDRRRRVRVAADDFARGAVGRVLFDLRRHPHWQGPITALRIAIGAPAEQRIQLRRLQASRGNLAADRLTAALTGPWIVEMGRDARSAWLVAPGLDVTRSLELPPDARLEAAWALPEGYPSGSRVQLVWEAAGRSPAVLLDHAVAADEHGRWHPIEADLGDAAGQRGELTFRIIGPTPDGTLLGAFGHPEITVPRTSPKPPDVVLLSLDTLRADRLSAYGYRLPTSPKIDAWAARRALVFEQAFSAAPWTLPAHASMFTGLDAHRHGVNHDAPLPPPMTTLAEHLRRAGYRTRAVTGGSFLLPAYGMAQGFDRFVHHPSRSPEEKAVELERGLDVALEMLREAPGQPLFLLLHTYETHAPYRPRQPFFEALHGYPPPDTPGVPRLFRPAAESGFVDRRVPDIPQAPQLDAAEKARLSSDLYDSGVAHLDHQLGRLLEALEKRDRPLLVLTSDHGELLGEHGLAGHAYLYDENLRIPLIIATPDGQGAGGRVAEQVRSIDLLPTMLDLLGLPPAPDIDGVSLAAFFAGERPSDLPDTAWSYAARTNRGFSLRLRNRLKVVLDNSVWEPVAGRVRAFDLRHDPSESHPTAPPEQAVQRLRQTFEDLPGLWIELENFSDRPLDGELEGPLVSAPALKSASLGDSRWSLPDRDQAVFHLPAGGRARVRAEVVPNGKLTISARLDEDSVWQVTLDRTALEQDHQWWLAGGRWTTEPTTGSVQARIGLSWSGPQRAADRAVSTEDEDLRQQLRALGYID